MRPHPVLIKPEAEADLTSIRKWYADISIALADRFTASVDAAILRIESIPEAFAVIYRDVRRAILKGFPCGVYFRIEASQSPVFAVKHFAQGPKVWQSRA